MSDIVERLRTSADECEFTTRSKLLREASAEIKGLRMDVADWRGCAKNAADESERLEFEYQRADESARRLGTKWKEGQAEIERLQSDLSVQKAMIRFHQKNEAVLKATLAKSCEDTRYEDYDTGCPRAKRANVEIERLQAEIKRLEKLGWPQGIGQ